MIDSRISRIARRAWRDRAAEAAGLNAVLRAPGGSQTLHDIQAVSLLEAWDVGSGVCVYSRVGTGKTLMIGLLPTLMAAHPRTPCTRPLIVVPGSLREKTEAEFASARAHWRVAHQYWLESYTALAQESRADILDERQPDMLLFDEPDGLRRINATSRRIGRYLQSRRERGLHTFCGFFHATPYRDAITDCGHMINWALGESSPLPSDPVELGQWSSWLDQEDGLGKISFTKYFGEPPRLAPDGPTPDAVAWSEDRFRERVTSCPGLILSDDTFTGSELSVHVHNVDPGLNREFEMLRTLWQKPDGFQLADGSEASDPDEVNTWSTWAVARQMAIGMFYRADPAPPKAWMAARKVWFDYVRAMIEAPNSKFDTEKQVRTACEKAAERGGRKSTELETWLRLKDTFVPNAVPVWMSTHALDAAKAWGSRGPGIIWTDHVAFGQRLAQETGWAFYGQRGLDSLGRRIEDAPSATPVIASRLANQRGRNLQHSFSRNLIMAVPNAGVDFEQLLGRTHRHGQRASKVSVDIYCACSEHAKALDSKLPKSSSKAERLFGLNQKLLGVNILEFGPRPTSWAWR